MIVFVLQWLSVLFYPSLTCGLKNTDFPDFSLLFNSYVFSPHLYCLFTFFHSLPELVSLSNLSGRMRVGKRVCVVSVTVCDVPSDPFECLKLHYIRFSILPPKPLCHRLSMCEEEEG